MVNKEAIIRIIKDVSNSDTLCKKKLQKLVYLVENKGVDLGCDYILHFYGPYSADLDYAVRDLCADGIVNIEYTPSAHKLSLSSTSEKCDYNNETITTVVEEFKKDSPSDLELIATALYVFNVRKDKAKIEEGVRKIKGDKYNTAQINNAINRLTETGYMG